MGLIFWLTLCSLISTMTYKRDRERDGITTATKKTNDTITRNKHEKLKPDSVALYAYKWTEFITAPGPTQVSCGKIIV